VFCLFACLLVCLFACLLACSFACLFVCLFACLLLFLWSVCLFFVLCLFVFFHFTCKQGFVLCKSYKYNTLILLSYCTHTQALQCSFVCLFICLIDLFVYLFDWFVCLFVCLLLLYFFCARLLVLVLVCLPAFCLFNFLHFLAGWLACLFVCLFASFFVFFFFFFVFLCLFLCVVFSFAGIAIYRLLLKKDDNIPQNLISLNHLHVVLSSLLVAFISLPESHWYSEHPLHEWWPRSMRSQLFECKHRLVWYLCWRCGYMRELPLYLSHYAWCVNNGDCSKFHAFQVVALGKHHNLFWWLWCVSWYHPSIWLPCCCLQSYWFCFP